MITNAFVVKADVTQAEAKDSSITSGLGFKTLQKWPHGPNEI